MQDFTIEIYCFVADLLKKIQPTPALDSRRKLSDAQVITPLLISARYFYGNQWAACQYMKEHWGFVMPDKSNFNRILHRLANLLTELFHHLSTIFKKLNIESVYIIDSFPVPICKNIRIPRAKLLQEEVFRGYNASKREYFDGFKVHLISTSDGCPIEVLVTPGSIHDNTNTALQMMDVDLPQKSCLYADAAYLNGEAKNYYKNIRELN
jgi:hypothetical protein